MTRTTRKLNKIQKLDEKIEAMLKEREEILNTAHKKIGELITNEWGTYDINLITKVVKELTPTAVHLISEQVNDSEDETTDNNEEY
ncbi:hypothetical protein MKX73_19150 [Solibacillus sp. FSL W7-1436]|uniref:hypothetical protein n=1 Tax=Solibacillus sp. FSL W7-1436 TaxID=2921705 RepID=UPI0030F87898